MGRKPCCSKVGLKIGTWAAKEDRILTSYIEAHGEGQWRDLPKRAGLERCGKSCRLRWMNYLKPDIKRGNITPDEEDLILRLHRLLGNRWSLIAGRLPGRTDNEIKNYWHTILVKKIKPNLSPKPKTTTKVLIKPIPTKATRAVKCHELQLINSNPLENFDLHHSDFKLPIFQVGAAAYSSGNNNMGFVDFENNCDIDTFSASNCLSVEALLTEGLEVDMFLNTDQWP